MAGNAEIDASAVHVATCNHTFILNNPEITKYHRDDTHR